MNNTIIRKISIGVDYKNEAMHYAVGQVVFGGNRISHIVHNDEKDSYFIYVENNYELMLWKSFNKNMAVAVEYNLDYDA